VIRKHFVILVMCMLCVTTQSGCKGLKSLVGVVKGVMKSGADDLMKAGRAAKGAVNASDDVARQLGEKAARGAGKWALKNAFKRLKEAMGSAEKNTTEAQAALMRGGPQAASRGMAFLRLRYEQNVAALNEEFSRMSEEMGESEGNAAQTRISRIAREQAAIASLAERME
jgi:hypothetical protein